MRFTGPIHIPNRGALWGEEDVADFRVVTPGYLALLRVPLLRGRHLSVDDRADTSHVVVVNQEAARRYWPGQDVLGQHVTCGQVGDECEVVGIVGNIRQQGPEFPPSREVYFPLAQMPPR